mgnify:CR=1 FL=1
MAELLPLRWLYLDLNSYFASVEQQMNPALRGRPVVVAPVMTDSTSAIAASYEAKAYGIRTGTKIWQAKAMCRDVVIVPGLAVPTTVSPMAREAAGAQTGTAPRP